MVPNRIGSMWKWLSSGMKIGQKITMISVHSSGQPSRKMMSCAVNWKPSGEDRKSTRLNSSHITISYAVFCLKKKKKKKKEKIEKKKNKNKIIEKKNKNNNDI